MTGNVKDELSRLPSGKACCRRAELSALLRFGDGLRLSGGRVLIEAELDSGLAARRLRREIVELYGEPARVRILPPMACATVRGMWCGWSATVRCWPAAPV